jgi:hypothetical protein
MHLREEASTKTFHYLARLRAWRDLVSKESFLTPARGSIFDFYWL